MPLFGLFGKGDHKRDGKPQGANGAAAGPVVVSEEERDERLKQVSVGTAVAGSDGEALGKITEIGRDYILVVEERSSMRRPKYIPAGWLTTIGHSKITLSKNTRWLMDNDLSRPPRSEIAHTGRQEPLLGAESAQPNFNRETPRRGRTRGPKGPLGPLPEVVVRPDAAGAAAGAAEE